MSDDSDLEDEVHKLRERVAYLERELGKSLEQERFKSFAERFFNTKDVEVSENLGGLSATGYVYAGDLKEQVHRIDGRNGYDWTTNGVENGMVELTIKKR